MGHKDLETTEIYLSSYILRMCRLSGLIKFTAVKPFNVVGAIST